MIRGFKVRHIVTSIKSPKEKIGEVTKRYKNINNLYVDAEESITTCFYFTNYFRGTSTSRISMDGGVLRP